MQLGGQGGSEGLSYLQAGWGGMGVQQLAGLLCQVQQDGTQLKQRQGLAACTSNIQQYICTLDRCLVKLTGDSGQLSKRLALRLSLLNWVLHYRSAESCWLAQSGWEPAQSSRFHDDNDLFVLAVLLKSQSTQCPVCHSKVPLTVRFTKSHVTRNCSFAYLGLQGPR
jgi:hypothetical protein